MRDPTIPHGIASVLHLLDAATRGGVSQDVCLAGSGVTPQQLADPACEISSAQELRIVRNIVRGAADAEAIALDAGLRYQLTDFGIWGYALISSPNLREALRLALRFLDLSYIYGELVLEKSAGHDVLRFDYHAIPDETRPFLLLRDLAAILAVQRQVFPAARPAIRFEFELPKPRWGDRLGDLMGIPVSFGTAATRSILDSTVLDQPMPLANEATRRMCEEECRKLVMRRRSRVGVSARVRDLLLRNPQDAPDMGGVASALGCTARTLRRRLALEGTTYRALRDEVLMMLAEELLGTGHLKLEDIAERLGYSDSASFCHAFKRWKGAPPRSVRAG
ncbi:MAG TPA: AraC family transcriptional regulator [Nevskiaceae bacterium]|nr:AraC family transcriptional regulator [Nevskiaceae bacterium]